MQGVYNSASSFLLAVEQLLQLVMQQLWSKMVQKYLDMCAYVASHTRSRPHFKGIIDTGCTVHIHVLKTCIHALQTPQKL